MVTGIVFGRDRSNAAGQSATTITRLISVWQDDYAAWNKRSLEGKQYVYVWADGVHFNIRLEEDRQCILVLMGATAEGRMELIAAEDGYRESEQSWRELLLDCKHRGMSVDPKLATGDGVQADGECIKAVAGTEWNGPDAGCDRRYSIRGWRKEKRHLKYLHPQDLTISPFLLGWTRTNTHKIRPIISLCDFLLFS